MRPSLASRCCTFWRIILILVTLLAACGRVNYRVASLDAAVAKDSTVDSRDALASTFDSSSMVLDAMDGFSLDINVRDDLSNSAGDGRTDVASVLDAAADATADANDALPPSSQDASEGGSGPPFTLTTTASDIQANDLARRPGGPLVIVGQVDGTLTAGGFTLPAQGSDGFIVFMNDDGSVRHARLLGGPGYDVAEAVALDSSGNVFVAGSYEGSVDFGGGTRIAAGPSGGYLVSYDVLGSHRFTYTFGGNATPTAYPPDNSGTAMAVHADGTVLLGGRFRGSTNFGAGPISSGGQVSAFMAAFENTGAFRWVRTFGSSGYNGIKAVTSTIGAGVFVGLYEARPNLGDGQWAYAGIQDAFVAKLDITAGTTIWTRNWGTSGFDYNNGVAAQSDGSLLVAGFTENIINVGTGALPRIGGRDALLVKLAADGSTLWAYTSGSSSCDEYTSVAAGTTGVVHTFGRFSTSPTINSMSGSQLGPASSGRQGLIVSYESTGGLQAVASPGTNNARGILSDGSLYVVGKVGVATGCGAVAISTLSIQVLPIP